MVASSAGFGLPAASADDVSTAQRRANAAANELSQAYTELAELDAEVARIETEHAAAEAELAGLRVIVNETAVRSYVHAGGADVPFLLGGDLNVEVRANALAQFVTMGSMDDIDRYRSMTADLETGAALLAQRKDAQAAAVERLRATKAAALKELARLQELKRKREQAEAARRAARGGCRLPARQHEQLVALRRDLVLRRVGVPRRRRDGVRERLRRSDVAGAAVGTRATTCSRAEAPRSSLPWRAT